MSSLSVCQGCLSPDRKLAPLGAYEKLYRYLLLTNPNVSTKMMQFCWECKRNFNNIQKFRLKITEAQKRLHSRLLHHGSLSTLTSHTKVDDYATVILEDEKAEMLKQELKSDKEDFWDDSGGYFVKVDIGLVESSAKDEFDECKLVKDEEDMAETEATYEYLEDIEMTDGKGAKKGYDKALPAVDVLEKKIDVPKKKKAKQRNKKYRIIILKDVEDKSKFYDKVIIDSKTAKEWMERRRERNCKKKYQCQLCFRGFDQKHPYDRHMASKHAEKIGPFKCDICSFRFAQHRSLQQHVEPHFEQFVCKLCKKTFNKYKDVYGHFSRHKRMRECLECGLRFGCKEFPAHYRNMHETFICDYCDKTCVKKKSLASHIFYFHSKHHCDICNKTFPRPDRLADHKRRIHAAATEDSYCVECDKKFTTTSQFKFHLKNTSRHAGKVSIPCPECGKIYSKKGNMNHHYALVHLKKTKYYCELCDKYLLNPYRLRQHRAYVHEKRPKIKNKFCEYCGKGFSDTRILQNHVRTHTGERPYACPHCPAAFTQSHCLTTHLKTHK